MKTLRHILQWLALVGVESAVEVVHCVRGSV